MKITIRKESDSKLLSSSEHEDMFHEACQGLAWVKLDKTNRVEISTGWCHTYTFTGG